ncbi:hypothetical protein Lesp02_08420 [Lentzea sp. NBRC 105346]|uniref:hypothetical protein n=1 Tax=Lentzea sp. NBRC 105346 TaxID=3032205 RepID=UPI0024A1432E|nr:hypothetical protein [Lentzea sp. NBRC 105346]GLZ28652.1 hypothetical protein Lesp02_08420 [Lentzea sp. NBRC 105346]
MRFSGDPEASWSILLEADLSDALDPGAVSRRLGLAVSEPSNWDETRAEFADSHYREGEPLIRVAVDDKRLMIAAHHGAVDGLGLLALLGTALDERVRSSATGVAQRVPTRSFLLNTADRLREAVFAPPTRIQPTQRASEAGDHLVSRELHRTKLGSTRLTWAALHAVRRWNARSDRVVAAIGASWRGGEDLKAEAASALLRLRLPSGADEDTVRGLLAAATPEAGFPKATNPLAQLGMRLLSSRLGSTFLVSNLGVADAGVRALRFYPSASGRSGVAFGVVTAGEVTTVTVRARRRDFSAGSAGELLDLLCDAAVVEDGPPRLT